MPYFTQLATLVMFWSSISEENTIHYEIVFGVCHGSLTLLKVFYWTGGIKQHCHKIPVLLIND